MSRSPSPLSRITGRLLAPVDIASLAAFRVLFGLLMLTGIVRFMLSGWISRFYGEPTFFFKYWGFDWVPVAPLWAMYLIYGALALAALAVALGFYYRLSIALFFVGFSYTELVDVTNYLNHYYQIALLSLLMCFMPLGRAFSLDARRKPALRSRTLPAWNLYLLRFQVGIVYFFAGLAKLGSDWLLHAQPLNIWLSARTEMPILGSLFDERWMAYVFSWAGFLFDTTIVLWLSWKRTRPYAYVVVVFFHLMTSALFNIGMFPYIMILSALLFFPPSWPRALWDRITARWARRGHTAVAAPEEPAPPAARLGALRTLGFAAMLAYCLVQVLLPLRHYLYPGDVVWNEEGMRFAWKVMLREKHGSITYHVRMKDTGKVLQVTPRRYLERRQEREMAGQPDLILQLAHHIAADFRARGYGEVEVRVEALVSLNGRPATLMLDPERDLTQVSDGLDAKDWILPAPRGNPVKLRPRAGL